MNQKNFSTIQVNIKSSEDIVNFDDLKLQDQSIDDQYNKNKQLKSILTRATSPCQQKQKNINTQSYLKFDDQSFTSYSNNETPRQIRKRNSNYRASLSSFNFSKVGGGSVNLKSTSFFKNGIIRQKGMLNQSKVEKFLTNNSKIDIIISQSLNFQEQVEHEKKIEKERNAKVQICPMKGDAIQIQLDEIEKNKNKIQQSQKLQQNRFAKLRPKSSYCDKFARVIQGNHSIYSKQRMLREEAKYGNLPISDYDNASNNRYAATNHSLNIQSGQQLKINIRKNKAVDIGSQRYQMNKTLGYPTKIIDKNERTQSFTKREDQINNNAQIKDIQSKNTLSGLDNLSLDIDLKKNNLNYSQAYTRIKYPQLQTLSVDLDRNIQQGTSSPNSKLCINRESHNNFTQFNSIFKTRNTTKNISKYSMVEKSIGDINTSSVKIRNIFFSKNQTLKQSINEQNQIKKSNRPSSAAVTSMQKLKLKYQKKMENQNQISIQNDKNMNIIEEKSVNITSNNQTGKNNIFEQKFKTPKNISSRNRNPFIKIMSVRNNETIPSQSTNRQAQILISPNKDQKSKQDTQQSIKKEVSDEKEQIFNEDEIDDLYKKKCMDLSISVIESQQLRFRETINKLCVNRKCNLKDMFLGPLFVQSLCEHIMFDKIAVLNLSKNNIGDQGVKHLMSVVKVNQSLVYLNISSNDISTQGFNYIFDAMIINQSIITLSLATINGSKRNIIQKKSTEKLKHLLIKNKILESLDISGINLGNFGLNMLAKAFNHGDENKLQEKKKFDLGQFIQSDQLNHYEQVQQKKQIDHSILPQYVKEKVQVKTDDSYQIRLKYLKLQANDITDSKIMEDFKFNLYKSNLIQLDFSLNNLGDESIKQLASGLAGSKIKKLIMIDTKMSYIGAGAILRISKSCKNLTDIYLDKNQLHGSKMKSLNDVLVQNKQLRLLSLDQCQIGREGADWLSQGLSINTTLKTLILSENNFGDDGLQYIVDQMYENYGLYLEHLDLSNNFISDKIGVKIAKVFLFNKTYISLNLRQNSLTDKTAKAFIDHIKAHPLIVNLDLSRNFVPIKSLNEIQKICDKNIGGQNTNLIPNLKKEFQTLTKVKKNKEYLSIIHHSIRQSIQIENEDLDSCDREKENFQIIYKKYEESYQMQDEIFQNDQIIFTDLKNENNRLKDQMNALKEQYRDQIRAQEVKIIQMRKEQDKVLNQIKSTKNEILRTLEIQKQQTRFLVPQLESQFSEMEQKNKILDNVDRDLKKLKRKIQNQQQQELDRAEYEKLKKNREAELNKYMDLMPQGQEEVGGKKKKKKKKGKSK